MFLIASRSLFFFILIKLIYNDFGFILDFIFCC